MLYASKYLSLYVYLVEPSKRYFMVIIWYVKFLLKGKRLQEKQKLFLTRVDVTRKNDMTVITVILLKFFLRISLEFVFLFTFLNEKVIKLIF